MGARCLRAGTGLTQGRCARSPSSSPAQNLLLSRSCRGWEVLSQPHGSAHDCCWDSRPETLVISQLLRVPNSLQVSDHDRENPKQPRWRLLQPPPPTDSQLRPEVSWGTSQNPPNEPQQPPGPLPMFHVPTYTEMSSGSSRLECWIFISCSSWQKASRFCRVGRVSQGGGTHPGSGGHHAQV